MWKKAGALVLVGAVICFHVGITPGKAYEYADTPTEIADGIRIPQRVTLLRDTPYYVIPNTGLNKAEGVLSPQTVEVMEAESGWATSGNWWKIRTVMGERWIKTLPDQIEVAPPKTLSLMVETALYENPSEKSGSLAVLSPQNVTVVDAEKDWFRRTGDDYNPKRWIQIHTTWMGDPWIHLRLDQIGAYQDTNQIRYYSNVGYNRTPYIDFQTFPTDGTQTHQFLHELGQFRSLLGSVSQVETTDGLKWTPLSGTPVVPENITIKRNVSSPLYTYPTPYEDAPKLVSSEELHAIEKLSDDQYAGNKEEWYHVKTDQGEGWFNPVYAEPEDAEEEKIRIDLHNQVTMVYRYPNAQLYLNYGQLGPQTVHPLKAWTDPQGVRWYQVDSFVGKGWIELQADEDRVILNDRVSDMQLKGHTSHQGAFYKEQGKYSFGNETVGYEVGDEPFFETSFLARIYNFTISGPDPDGWWTLKNESGYAFQLKPGELGARTFWKGRSVQIVPLTKPPIINSNTAPLLGLTDIRTLLGASTTVSQDNHEILLSTRQYDIENLHLPNSVNGAYLKLSGFLYDENAKEQNAIVQSLRISVLDRDAQESSPKPIYEEASKNFLYNINYWTGLYDVSLQHPVHPGMNHLTVVFKVGERILAEYEWDVKGSDQAQ
ncbi:hypothetical protein [Paenibacillus rigui]|uniref:Uncharacterized protein n=1 Tax=Paenibacillus rigui TaxID=554312 RepID=A0A229UPK6_9BACL|nr:hypothetical protein [Paenibacillus rigui]OXM85145.1 hypothetical protein CF651_16190 [Paenibacillus rigui]